ncbi:MAG: DUF4269 domain-containing protein, partial [Atopostipes suicloacalis]|nr:DUF4269 domain-containing protein [Atopostipes suicloacalis]
MEYNIENRNWKDISYLKKGNPKQRKVYDILKEIEILEHLEDFSPIVVGTIPLAIDIETSDLDIVCQFDKEEDIREILLNHYGDYEDFKVRKMGKDAYAYNFWYEDCEIEVYGSKVPTKRSNSYRHLLIASRLLSLYGDEFRKKIVQLKKQGYLTERAIAKLLHL